MRQSVKWSPRSQSPQGKGVWLIVSCWLKLFFFPLREGRYEIREGRYESNGIIVLNVEKSRKHNLHKFFFQYFLYYMWMWCGSRPHGVQGDNFVELVLSFYLFWGLSSDPWQAPLLTEPSYWLSIPLSCPLSLPQLWLCSPGWLNGHSPPSVFKYWRSWQRPSLPTLIISSWFLFIFWNRVPCITDWP